MLVIARVNNGQCVEIYGLRRAVCKCRVGAYAAIYLASSDASSCVSVETEYVA